MEKLKAARPFVYKVPDSPERGFTRYIHLVNGRIYGCTGYSAVEFAVGDTGLPGIALKPEDISVLAAFRQEVT
jgi:hypothetical protein